MKTKLSTLIVFILFTAAYIFPQLKISDKTSLNYLKTNLQFLASDELEGRETGTRGEKLAAMFIASELQKYGVKPYGDNGTYFQNIKLSTGVYGPDSKIQLTGTDGSPLFDLSAGNDFLKAGTAIGDPSLLNISASIVMTGYGITAPEFKYDDYASVDVKGKIVLAMTGEPYSEDDNYFRGKRTTQYSTISAKVENAMKHGAVGILFLPESWRITFWDTYKKNSFKGTLTPPSNPAGIKMIPALVLSEEAAKKILTGEEVTYEKIKADADKKTDYKPFELKKKAKYNLVDNSQIKMAMNVVGIIEGSDPKLKNEFVLLSAHFDHVGVNKDVVFNGADDDGSGTVSVLETARIMNENKLNKRSVIALFNTGEEKGLWGSGYAANNSSFIPNTVADINIDMDGREKPNSIYAIGSNKLSTEFYNLIRDVNSKTVKMELDYKFDDPKDPERFFYRSDHYNFALKGIPIVFFFDDMKSDYHKSTDDVEKINFEKMLKVVKLSANVALRAANLKHRLVVDKKLEPLF
jgi:hypothetical protein